MVYAFLYLHTFIDSSLLLAVNTAQARLLVFLCMVEIHLLTVHAPNVLT